MGGKHFIIIPSVRLMRLSSASTRCAAPSAHSLPAPQTKLSVGEKGGDSTPLAGGLQRTGAPKTREAFSSATTVERAFWPNIVAKTAASRGIAIGSARNFYCKTFRSAPSLTFPPP
jgi:hypothetical protein